MNVIMFWCLICRCEGTRGTHAWHTRVAHTRGTHAWHARVARTRGARGDAAGRSMWQRRRTSCRSGAESSSRARWPCELSKSEVQELLEQRDRLVRREAAERAILGQEGEHVVGHTCRRRHRLRRAAEGGGTHLCARIVRVAGEGGAERAVRRWPLRGGRRAERRTADETHAPCAHARVRGRCGRHDWGRGNDGGLHGAALRDCSRCGGPHGARRPDRGGHAPCVRTWRRQRQGVLRAAATPKPRRDSAVPPCCCERRAGAASLRTRCRACSTRVPRRRIAPGEAVTFWYSAEPGNVLYATARHWAERAARIEAALVRTERACKRKKPEDGRDRKGRYVKVGSAPARPQARGRKSARFE